MTGAAERQRRYRARRAAGTVRVDFELSAGGIALLAALGWIAEANRADPEAVRDAFDAFVNAAAAAGVTCDAGPQIRR